MLPSFDDDTALEPLGPGRWRGTVRRHWYAANGANGGLLLAHATRAMQLTAGADRVPRSLTMHFLTAPTEGDLDYEVTVERGGRAVTFVSLRATRDGATLATGLGVLVAPDDAPDMVTQPASGFPAVPAPEAIPSFRPVPGRLGAVLGNYDLRHALGEAPLSGATEALAGGWIRTAAPRPLDAVALAAYTDAWWPPAYPRVTTPALLPTLDLTVHWRGAAPEGAHPWVLCRFEAREIGGGMFDEQGELWSADGRLLVQSRQLALLRPLRV